MFILKSDRSKYSITLDEVYKAKNSYAKPYCRMYIDGSEYGFHDTLLSKDDLESWIRLSEGTLNGEIPTGTIRSNDNGQSRVEVNSTSDGSFYLTVKRTLDSYIEVIAVFDMEQLRQLKDMLPKEIESFFTENHGKIAYYTYKELVNESNFEWIYRASELQEILTRYMINDHIEHIFIELSNYIDSSAAPGFLDYNGGIIFVLGKIVIDLSILCNGVFGLSIIDRSKIAFERTFGFVPDDVEFPKGNDYEFDLLDIADASLRNCHIKSCDVTSTEADWIPFTPDSFNIEKARLYNEVPSCIQINFDCGHHIDVYGSDMECFGVTLN